MPEEQNASISIVKTEDPCGTKFYCKETGSSWILKDDGTLLLETLTYTIQFTQDHFLRAFHNLTEPTSYPDNLIKLRTLNFHVFGYDLFLKEHMLIKFNG